MRRGGGGEGGGGGGGRGWQGLGGRGLGGGGRDGRERGSGSHEGGRGEGWRGEGVRGEGGRGGGGRGRSGGRGSACVSRCAAGFRGRQLEVHQLKHEDGAADALHLNHCHSGAVLKVKYSDQPAVQLWPRTEADDDRHRGRAARKQQRKLGAQQLPRDAPAHRKQVPRPLSPRQARAHRLDAPSQLAGPALAVAGGRGQPVGG